MVYCAAFGCTNIQKKGCGLSFFSFPKDAARSKTWIVYCRRDRFEPTKSSRLCSEHFSKVQLDRDPERLKENYEGAKIRLRKNAVTDIPLRVCDQDENATFEKFLAVWNQSRLLCSFCMANIFNQLPTLYNWETEECKCVKAWKHYIFYVSIVYVVLSGLLFFWCILISICTTCGLFRSFPGVNHCKRR